LRQSMVNRVFLLDLTTPSCLSTTCTVWHKTDTVVVPVKHYSSEKVTTGVNSLEDDASFQELKARVIKLRAAQLDLLKQRGLLDSKESPLVTKKYFTCSKCGKDFKTANGLAQHTKLGGKCNRKPQSEVKEKEVIPIPTSFKCGGCGNVYKHESSLKKHLKTNALCGQAAEENNKLLDRENVKPVHQFKCTFCEKEFKSKAGLTKHLRSSGKCSTAAAEVVASQCDEEASHEEETVEESKQESMKPVDLEEKQEILIAYFDTLINTGRLMLALEEFKIIKNNAGGKEYIVSIELYDKLLRGVARKNDIGKIQELWKEILASGLQPSLNSFISVMISFHRVDGSKNVFKTIFKQIYEDFTEAGFTVAQALNVGEFHFSDKKLFMEVISTFLGDDILATGRQDQTVQDIVADLEHAGSAQLVSHIDTVLRREQLDDLLTRQLKMEMKQSVTIPSISRKSKEQTEQFRKFTAGIESQWREKISETLAKKVSARNKLPSYLRGTTINMHQFLTCIPLNQLTDIILAMVRNVINSENFSLPVALMTHSLGNEVMLAYHKNLKTNDTSHSFRDYVSSLSQYYDWYCSPQSGSPNHRAAIQSVTEDLCLEQTFTVWPKSVRYAVGSELFNIIYRDLLIDRDREGYVISDSKIINNKNKLARPVEPVTTCPAFFKVFRKRKAAMDVEELKPHPSLSAVFDFNSMVDLEFPAKDLPMLVPPLPWVSSKTGAYLVQDSNLIKVPEANASAHDNLIENLPPGGLNPVLDSINQLSSVPWIVNKPVLELACKLFLDQSDERLLNKTDLPRHPDNIPQPQLSQDLEDVLAARKSLTGAQVDEYRRYVHQKSLQAQMKSETYSLWCSALYRLSLASHFQDDVLWFPHNIDFRGRCYPLPPQLNHMGADLARSLLVFAKGKKLGKDGLRWLKLHCINLTGTMKKESIEARLEYVESIMPKIIQSATTPLEGERWWLESDDPWQTYSMCVEIKKALEHPEGPENYISHLPLHQDGSCNGLQHYAALGRDQLGARAVNLVPCDKPQDVYSEIAAIVDRKREEDSRAGVEIAASLEGFIKRKVVKQTVMTTVYGVTKYGASLQIAKQLKDTDDFPVSLVEPASKYLAHKTFESLNELFTASQEIQDWFTECAMIISKDCQSNVSWVTPLGFPVIQPYSKMEEKLDKSVTLQMTNMFKQPKSGSKEIVEKINTRRNKNGFPPNFIHSLDSSHMMLTSLHLWSQGVTFASVHDCFWTHASDAETMNRVCREQFIALHSYPVLENLSDYFMKHFHIVPDKLLEKKMKDATLARKLQARDMERKKREMLFKNLPKRGDLDLDVIHDSVYFFS